MRCPHHKKKLNDQMINQLNNKENYITSYAYSLF